MGYFWISPRSFPWGLKLEEGGTRMKRLNSGTGRFSNAACKSITHFQFCSGSVVFAQCEAGSPTLPFEDCTPSMEDFGIPTKINVFLNSFQIQTKFKFTEDFGIQTKINRCTKNCNKSSWNGT